MVVMGKRVVVQLAENVKKRDWVLYGADIESWEEKLVEKPNKRIDYQKYK